MTPTLPMGIVFNISKVHTEKALGRKELRAAYVNFAVAKFETNVGDVRTETEITLTEEEEKQIIVLMEKVWNSRQKTEGA